MPLEAPPGVPTMAVFNQRWKDTRDVADETPQAPQKKPGFFSRLFTARDVAPPPEELPSMTDVPRVEEQPEPVVVETAEEKKPSFLERLFGTAKKEAPAAPPVVEVVPAPPVAAPKSWFERLRDRLLTTSGSWVNAIRSVVGMSGRLDDATVEQLEEILIGADVGMETALKMVERMKKRARAENIEGADNIMRLFRETVAEVFTGNVKPFNPGRPEGPYVVMVVGVNGVGKTTTIGKMARRCRAAGLKTMLVAGDTFRAAAVEQLEVWAKRTGSDFIRGKDGADPSSLAYDALNQAKANGVDVVFMDTAGRLHTKTSLMDELGKISRVIGKILPGAPHETLLVIDATTGQNAVQQVKMFSAATPLDGLVLTKLDGTAKGGILITIRDQFNVPVTLIGVGEGADDLRDFDPEQFVAALFGEGKVS